MGKKLRGHRSKATLCSSLLCREQLGLFWAEQ